jgi:Domain of unknown function (DUF5666)
MNPRPVCSILFGLALATAASAQNASTPAPPAPKVQTQPQNPGSGADQDSGQRRGGRGSGMGMGRGVMGTVTEVAADHYTIKNDAGETYTIHYSANTRILKQQARPAGERGGGVGGQSGQGGGNPPIPLKPTDIKVGDAVAAMGEVDAAAKSVGAVMVMQIDPERARQMREMQASHGKTWIMGKVTAIDGVKVTILDGVDNAPHIFVADENTTFRKRRDPITLADIQVGDSVRVEGSVKEGAFAATTVTAMGGGPGANPTVPRSGPPPAQPQ